jgi:uncharacterized protein with FMN-binding domain
MKPHLLTRTAFSAAASVAVLLPLAACTSEEPPSTSTSTPPPTTSAPADPTPSQTAEAEEFEYVDGTYTARGYYGGAPSYMTFTVTLDDGVITDVESELMPDNNDTSRGYQERFAAALPDEVVGRSVDEVEVGVLAGSRSCGDGFNDALAQIRDEARSDQ